MTRKAKSSNLTRAKRNKKDEFYTQIRDIEQELLHYRDQFRGKVIYCNCDDPVESEFYRYFHLNFHFFGMKKLLSTHYDKDNPTYSLVYEGGTCEESDNDYNSYDQKIPLKEDGDFRSDESIDLLKQSDIVVTNPPFSLFREYVAQLIKYKKKFIIWRNLNAVTYKEIFPLIKDQKMWIGFTANKTCIFRLADDYTKWDKKATAEHNDGHKYGKVPSITVYTNMPIKKPTDRVILWETFSQDKFPTYDNYAGFECSKVSHLPQKNEIDAWIDKNRLTDFKHTYQSDLTVKEERDDKVLVHIKRPVFGVPITFLCKYNPSEIGGGVKQTGSVWQTSTTSSAMNNHSASAEKQPTSRVRESTAESLFDQDKLAKHFEILGEASGNSYRNMPKLLERLSFHPEMKYGGGLGSALINGKAKYSRILIRSRYC